MNISFENRINLTNYKRLRESVEFVITTDERTKVAIQNSLYLIAAYNGAEAIGMARVVGDGGYVYFICDVIVHPDYQSRGLGRQLITNVLAWLKAQVLPGETIMINLMSAYEKEPFYEKLGFHRRPFGNHGSGMSCWLEGGADEISIIK